MCPVKNASIAFDDPRHRYIEDITRWREDMDFIFDWWKQYFTNERREWVKYCFHHENIKFHELQKHSLAIVYRNQWLNWFL